MSYKKLSSIGNSTKESYETIVPEISSLKDKEDFISKNKICVVDVYATWCNPCNIVIPLYNDLFKKYNIPGICTLVKENVELGLSKDVQVIPMFQVFFNGEKESLVTGIDMESLEAKIKSLIEEI